MVRATILLGIFSFVSLILTIISGILMRKGKLSLKYHIFFAVLTVILSINHAALIIYRSYF
jgi:hypothetical protein